MLTRTPAARPRPLQLELGLAPVALLAACGGRAAAGHAMAHSTETYLLDEAGLLRHHLFFGASPELIAGRIREIAD